MLIIAHLMQDGREYTRVFSCWDMYYEHIFDPSIEIIDVQVYEE